MDFLENNYDSLAGHTSPRKNVLLLSCMDLRLLDNLVAFMNFENLENRYDQFILAGAAAGANQLPTWNQAFFDHFLLAIALHEIKYVFIVEHRDCGAYGQFFGQTYVHYDETLGVNCYHRDREREDHRREAFALRDQINEYCRRRRADPWPPGDSPGEESFLSIIRKTHGQEPDIEFLRKLWRIEVRCYLMDLRGGIEWLDQDAEMLNRAHSSGTPMAGPIEPKRKPSKPRRTRKA